jgi:hypothetical protein
MGGGIFCLGYANPINDCVITQNHSNQGGGVHCYGTNARLGNCLIVSNSAGNYGGGVCCYYHHGSPRLYNCTVADNSAKWGGGLCCYESTPALSDSIVWGNTSSVEGNQINVRDGASNVTLDYCCFADNSLDSNNIHGNVIENAGCVCQNPLFASGPGSGYYLSHVAAGQGEDSPCIDTGSDTAAFFGLAGRTTRSDGVTDSGTVDMGYHYKP